MLVLTLLLSALTPAASAHDSQANRAPPTLTTAAQVRRLTIAESPRGYAVHLQSAVVLIYDPVWGMLFVHDATGVGYVNMKGQPPRSLRSGQVVEVEGFRDPVNTLPSSTGPWCG